MNLPSTRPIMVEDKRSQQWSNKMTAWVGGGVVFLALLGLAGSPFLVWLLGLYLIPALIAASRSSRLDLATLMVNLFLGWTVIGWVGALVMATLPHKKVLA